MVEIVIGSKQVILEISDTILSVNEGEAAPTPTPPFTTVQKVYTVAGKDYYIQQRIKDGTFVPA